MTTLNPTWRDHWASRWPSFTPEEILSPDGIHLAARDIFPISFAALDKLESFREFVGFPLLVNHGTHVRRGFRSVKDLLALNKELTRPEDQYSFHLWCAFDLSPASKDIEVALLHKLALDFTKDGGWGGVGHYKTFVHVDDRNHLVRDKNVWDYTT